MGFLAPDPVKLPHSYCALPNLGYRPEGTRWQCDECRKIYRIESVMDRNITALEWVHQK